MTQQQESSGLSIAVENVDDSQDLKRMLSLASTSSADFSDVIKSSSSSSATATTRAATTIARKTHARGSQLQSAIARPSLLNPNDFNRDEANRSKMALPFSAKESRQQLTSSNHSTLYDQLLSLSRSSSFAVQKRMQQFDTCDIEFLKNTQLFSGWNDDQVLKFIEEDRIRVKKSKNNEMIADGDQCKEHIYLAKSGSIQVWLKMTRDHINYHEKKLKQEMADKNEATSGCSKPQSAVNSSRVRTTASKLSLKKESEARISPKLSQMNSEDTNIRSSDAIERTNQVFFKAASASVAKLPTLSGSLTKRPTVSTSKSSLNMMHTSPFVGYNLTKANTTLSAKSLKSTPTRPTSLSAFEKSQQRTKQQLQPTLNPGSSVINDIWKNSFPLCQNNCFLEFLILGSGQIFGLSDFLFDVEKEKANLIEMTLNGRSMGQKVNRIEENKAQESVNENDCNSMSSYHLISCGTSECYIIDREFYFKTMYSVLNDKQKINELFSSLRQTCTKLPLIQEMDEKFMKHLIWNVYKRRIYKSQLNEIAYKRSIRHYYNPNRSRFLLTSSLA